MHSTALEVKAAGATSRTTKWWQLVQEASLRYTDRKSSEGRLGSRSGDENKEILPHELHTEESIVFLRMIRRHQAAR